MIDKEELKRREHESFLTAVCMLLFVVLMLVLSITASAAELTDITEPCGLTTQELQKGLKFKLSDYAENFIEAEEEYGINAVFLAAVAAHESGWGTSTLAENKNNLFGWKGDGGYKEFDDFEHCIDFVAWKLYKNYIREGLDTIEEIAPVYCNEAWAGYIKEIINEIRKDEHK